MVAVIIPIKMTNENKENFRRTLDSLVSQIYTRFITVICEDKESLPTNEIIEKYSNKLTIAHLKNNSDNVGAGVARNLGLDWATAHNIESAVFLDADDLLLPHAMDQLTYELNHNLADVVINTNLFSEDHLYSEAKNHLKVWVTGNIYRLSFLNKFIIRFPYSFKTNEDLAFSLKVLSATSKIFYLKTPHYLVISNKFSTTSIGDSAKDVCGIDYVRAVRDVFDFHIINDLKIDTLLPNIFFCYNYSQSAFLQYRTTNSELINLLTPILTYLKTNKLLTTKTIEQYQDCFHHFFKKDGKLLSYPQNPVQWFSMLGIDFNELGEK